MGTNARQEGANYRLPRRGGRRSRWRWRWRRGQSSEGLDDNGGVGGDVQAELAALLAHVHRLGARRGQKLDGLHEAAEHDGQERHGDDDAGAGAAAGAEGQEAEVVAGRLDLAVQEALRHEAMRLLPVLGVVGDPPGVHQDLALGRDVVARQLGLVEVHVGHQEGDGHVQAHHLLHERRQVRQLVVVCVGLRDQVALAQHQVQLVAHARLHLRVVHELRHPPLDRPQRCLNRGHVDVLHDVQHVVFVDFALLLCVQNVVDGALLPVGLRSPGAQQFPAIPEDHSTSISFLITEL